MTTGACKIEKVSRSADRSAFESRRPNVSIAVTDTDRFGKIDFGRDRLKFFRQHEWYLQAIRTTLCGKRLTKGKCADIKIRFPLR